MHNIEARLDYFEILKTKAKRLTYAWYECLVCGRKIGAHSKHKGSKGLTGNARGAITNHLKGHMRKGEV